MVVLVDANILIARTLRDWLINIYLASQPSPFEVCWTEDIMAETMFHIRRNNPLLSGGQIARVRELIDATFTVVRDYDVDPGIPYPDEHDAHVHAAAVTCQADFLLTNDTKGFALEPALVPYEIYTADEFFCLVDDLYPDLAHRATLAQLNHWRRKDPEHVDLPGQLEIGIAAVRSSGREASPTVGFGGIGSNRSVASKRAVAARQSSVTTMVARPRVAATRSALG